MVLFVRSESMAWQLQLSDICDPARWSYGLVKTIDDLYDARIFGSTRDAACECGKYEGCEHDGVICDLCGVKVATDSAALRRTRTGHVQLYWLCTHPLGTGNDWIYEFAVAPIAYRLNADGTPNALGRKYEKLLQARDAVIAHVPEENRELHVLMRDRTIDRTPVQVALNDLVGVGGSESATAHELAPPDTVLHEVFLAIRHLDPGVSGLLHAAGCSIRYEGTM